MGNSTRLSDTVHLLATVQIVREVALRKGEDARACLSSAAIAASIHTNPSYVRQLMMTASRAGLLVCERGRANPVLGRPAREISLLDIYRAVEKEKPLLRLDTHINPECNVGIGIQMSLGSSYDKVQKCAEECMATITLQDVIDGFYSRMGRDSLPD
ncbi:MAG: Rrf2 family transcriptional regulator [Desulfovibrionaceae bacterium]|nr:Rrf2 family transcriptional regulator [Desulfovibrionaceae bacterium]